MNILKQNTITAGIVLGLGVEIVTALLLWVVLLILGMPAEEHIRWFGVAFIPLVLLLRYMIKKTDRMLVSKTLMGVLFFSFVAFMFIIL
ncbi:MAG: hypothetical protein MJZ81_04445 [Bacteroidales bacterium]|nr:hypothetical protein [Bacteroidales bacterium]